MGEAWSKHVQAAVDARYPGLREQLDKAFSATPKALVVGPWSWSAGIFISLLWAGVVCFASDALQKFEALPQADSTSWIVRLLGFCTGLAVLRHVLRAGPWVMSTWTMLGWTCTTIRYFAGVIGLHGLQRALTFPSIAANIITVIVWYAGILPGILLAAAKENRPGIIRDLVVRPIMVTIHGFNAIFALLDWRLQPLGLNRFDLWMGLIYGCSYVTFYTTILDPIGAHFYFILTPRRWWSALVYAGVLSVGLSAFFMVNSWASLLDKQS